jgi:hypothetical protein
MLSQDVGIPMSKESSMLPKSIVFRMPRNVWMRWLTISNPMIPGSQVVALVEDSNTS